MNEIIIKDGANYVYCELNETPPNYTVWDNRLFTKPKMRLKKFLSELYNIFLSYEGFEICDFSITLINSKKDTLEISPIVIENDSTWIDELPFSTKYDFIANKSTKYYNELGLLNYLTKFTRSNELWEVTKCNIQLLKPKYFRVEWKPKIPKVTEKKTPRRKIKKIKNDRNLNGVLRQHILSRDNKICQHCGVDISEEFGNKSHIDHIIPYKQGGPNEPWNLQVLCSQCNLEKNANDKLKIDKQKLNELKAFYNIKGELKKYRGKYNYYDESGKCTSHFTKKEIKKLG